MKPDAEPLSCLGCGGCAVVVERVINDRALPPGFVRCEAHCLECGYTFGWHEEPPKSKKEA